MTGELVFVLGGARSGKSRFAEGLIEKRPAPWHYVATAQGFDAEMRERIACHQARRDARWITHNAPHDLAGQVSSLPDGAMLVDCLTLWLSNRMLAKSDVEIESTALVRSLRARDGFTVVVANEVGLGIVPETPLGRRYRDAAGRLNQAVAAAADVVHFIAAGLSMRLK